MWAYLHFSLTATATWKSYDSLRSCRLLLQCHEGFLFSYTLRTAHVLKYQLHIRIVLTANIVK